MPSGGKRSTSFKPGRSYNPGGKPKNPAKIAAKKAAQKVIADVKQLARECGEDAINALKDVMTSPKSPPAAKVSAASAILDRGYGKPPAFVTGDADQFRDLVEMSDAELLAIVAGGRPEKPNVLN